MRNNRWLGLSGFGVAILVGVTGLLVSSPSLAAAEATLKVGDPAPALRFAKVYKGQSLETLDPKQTYIVECWATWCGPCRAAFPHLSALAKELEGKVTVIGVDVCESKSATEVQQFVDKQADKMAYTVAADPNGMVATNWLNAAGQNGIPFSFVVAKGKIAWMGNPTGLSAPMVLALAEGKVAVQSLEELLKPVFKLRDEGKPADAVAKLDALAAEHREFADAMELNRFYLLLEYDEPAAYRVARKLLEGNTLKNNESGLYRMAHRLVFPTYKFKMRDWDLALAVTSRLNQIAPDPNPAYLWTLAEAKAGKQDYAGAIATMQSLFPVVDTHPATQGDRKFYEERLEAFQKAQKLAAARSQASN
jgi:thiol-disulfide isomerase/thioredoxin